jgi:putative tryptophan/tyrosine transport system substrate-binding protein
MAIHIQRREFITLLGGGAAAWPLAARAQQAGRMRRIGIVSPAASETTVLFNAFRLRLRELGYIEGRTIELDFGLAAGALDRVPALASDLLRQHVDVLVADGAQVVGVLQSMTKTIPTIAIMGVDPVADGIVSSLARPGGNITGVTTFAIELHTKRIALLAEAVPPAKHIAFLMDRSQDPRGLVSESTERSASQLGLQLEMLDEPHLAGDLPNVLRREVLARFDGIIVGSGPLFWNNRRQIVALVAESRRPAIYPERDYVDVGGFMSYGPNIPSVFRRLAELVDRILKGDNPAEIPFERVTHLEFIINLRIAQNLGVTIPPALPLRADEVIE